jgi:CDP-glucose 4,6-dehydratase
MINDLENTYKGKRIFLTGHTGFKGSWMIAVFNMLGANVKGYSLPPAHKNGIYNLISANDLCDSFYGDINDFEKLKSQITEFQPDFIFHLAAQPLVRYSYSQPIETFQTNIIGTANLLESVKEIDNDCTVVIITTDKVYHNNEWEYPYRENDKLGGFDPYSASKACAELVVDSYRNSFFPKNNIGKHRKKIVTARAGNVIGGGDRAIDRIIPDIIRSVENNQELNVRNPNSIRPWQHVLEPIFGYLKLAALIRHSDIYEDSWNFGPNLNDCLQVYEIVNVAKGFFPNLLIRQNHEIFSQLHEAQILKLDISRTSKFLNWEPKWNSETALNYTFDWYKSVEKASPLHIVNLQISDYFKQ